MAFRPVRDFRLVRHEHVLDYLNLGWDIAADLGPTHGHWSVLMRWVCGCKCVEPLK